MADVKDMSTADLQALAAQSKASTASTVSTEELQRIASQSPEPIATPGRSLFREAPAPVEDPGQLGQSVLSGVQNFPTQQIQSKVLDLLDTGIQKLPVSQGTRDSIQQTVNLNPVVFGARLSRKLFAPADGFVPTTPAEKTVAEVTSFFDPATLVLGGAAFKGTGIILKTMSLGKKADKLQKLAKVAKGGELLGLSGNSLKSVSASVNRRIALNRFKQLSVKSAVGGATEEATRTAATQVRKGEFKPKDLAANVLVGAGAGAVGGPVADVALRAAGRGAGRFRSLFTAEAPVNSQAVDSAFSRAKAKAADLVKKGTIQNEDVISQQIFLDDLERRGLLRTDDVPLVSKFEEGLLNTIELSDALDRKLGTRLTQASENLIQGRFQSSAIKSKLLDQFGQPVNRLEKLGVARTEISQLLLHVENAVDGSVVFNPAARQLSKTFSRDALSPELAQKVTPEVVTELSQIRKVFNDTFSQSPGFADRAGFVEGYVPLLRKQGGVLKANVRQGSTKQVENAFFLKTRTSKKFDPSIHETDFGRLARFYADAAGKDIAFRKHLPSVYSEIAKLQWLGRGNEAQLMAKKWSRALGIRNPIDLNRLFGDELARANDPILEELAQASISPQAFKDEMLQLLKKTTFNSLVFKNPRTIIKQLAQPELVGQAEIGARWVASGRRQLLTKEGRKAADNAMDLMRSRNASDFAELQFDQFNNKFIRTFSKVDDILSKPGQFAFNKLDIANRGTAYLGARKQFLTNAGQNLEVVLDGLLEGEKNTVTQVLQRDGFEAAANMYGLIRSRRINYAYSIADTPEFWAEGIGKHVPFTTWSRNQLARVIGDVRGRNVKKLAARAIKPLLLISAFKLVTGYDVPNAHPLTAVAGVASTRPFPALADPAEQFAKTGQLSGVVREFENFTPIGVGKRFARDFKKGKSFGEKFLRLKEIKSNSTINKIRKDILRNFR